MSASSTCNILTFVLTSNDKTPFMIKMVFWSFWGLYCICFASFLTFFFNLESFFPFSVFLMLVQLVFDPICFLILKANQNSLDGRKEAGYLGILSDKCKTNIPRYVFRSIVHININ